MQNGSIAYPYQSGENITVIGPECFTDGVTICYQGVNYIKSPEVEDE